MAGLHEGDTRIMINGLGVHRTHHRDIVGNGTDVREQLGDFHAGLAVLIETETAAHTVERLPHELRDALASRQAFRHRLAVHFYQLGLGIKEIQMRRRARLEEVDHPLGPRGSVQHAGILGKSRNFSGCAVRRSEQRGQGGGSNAPGTPSKKMAPRQMQGDGVFSLHVHSRVTDSSRLRRALATPVQAARSATGKAWILGPCPTRVMASAARVSLV